jgi:GMP synthase (glutamine-hydrolysing)
LDDFLTIDAPDVDDDFIKKFNPKGVILSGGPDTVTLNDSARAPQIVFDLGVLP